MLSRNGLKLEKETSPDLRREGTATLQNAELRTVELAHGNALRVQNFKRDFLILLVFRTGFM